MDTNESQDVVTEEVIEETETVEETVEDSETTDNTTEESSKVEKPKETLEQKAARLKRELKQTEKKLGINDEKPAAKAKSDGLGDTELDFLDLKGVTESEDISVIEAVVKKTGMTVREALKDEYVVAKLASNKASRDVKAATPSATKRSGGTSDNVALALSKFEQTGEMPENFELRSKVIDALESKSRTNAPSWHK